MPKTYKYVIFDFSDTLCHFVAKDYLATLCDGDAARAEKLHNKIFHSAQWRLYDRGKVSEEENKRALLELLDPAESAVADIYLDHWHEHYHIIDGMPEIIADLQSKGIKVYLLSSYPERFEKVYERFPFLQQLNGKLISYQAGVGKDDPEFFMMLLNKYSLSAEECIYFDDDPNAISVACTLGIDGHVFRDAATTRKTLGI